MDTSSFFTALERRAAADTAVIATLRRSCSSDPGTDPAAFPYIEPRIAGLTNGRRALVYLVAGLWAMTAKRAGHGQGISLATAMKRAAKNPSVEQRFVALLDADVDELRWRLRQALTLVASQRTAINWPQLLDDLLRWESPSRHIQTRWAREFWGQQAEDAA